MGDVFRAYHVGGLQEWPTLSIGSGQSLTQTNAPKLGGVPGDLRITLANQNAVYVEKIVTWPTNPTSFRFRVYYDFSGLTMAEGNQFEWLHVRSATNNHQIIGGSLNYASGVLQHRIYSYEDAEASFDSAIIAINNQRSWLEFACTLASSSSADDGTLYVYEEEALIYSRTSYQQYTSILEGPKLRVGGVSGMDAGTSGTLDFGKIILASGSNIIGPHDPNEIVHLWMPPGNQLTQWTGSVVGSGQAINYDTSAALGGIPGDMAVVIANQNNAYKQVSGLDLSATTTVRIRCYLDSSQLTMAADGLFTLLTLRIPSVTHRFGCAYGSTSGQHYLLFRKMEDGGALRVDNNVNISAGVHYIEMLLQKASSSIAGDGKAIYYLNGVEVARWENIDIYDDFVALSELRVGASADISPLDVGTSGTFYLGKLQIRDDNTEIGALPLNLQRLLTLHRLTDLTVTLG